MTTDPGRSHLVPNLLSFSRIPLAALLWVAPYTLWWTLGVMALAGITDVLDGWFARRARARMWVRDRDPGAFSASVARGAMIDGLADKIFVASALVLLAWTVQPAIWVLLVLAAREILFVPMMIAYRLASDSLKRRVDFTAGRLGKAATIAQFAALVLGLFDSSVFVPMAIVAGTLGAAASLIYIVRALAVTSAVRSRAADLAPR